MSAVADLAEAPPALAHAIDLARRGRLYPAVILHGGSDEARREAAAFLGRTLLCERPSEERPCGVCRHCRRIVAPPAPASKETKADDEAPFHPDFAVLLRDDKKTVTGAEATRIFLGAAHLSPFEARGQVFVVAEAQTLSGEAGDALLKLLEEPGLGAPRHFLLLAPTRLDLSATLRSRSMSLFLGAAAAISDDEIAELADRFADSIARFARTGLGLHLLEAASALAPKDAFDDPRAEEPWIAAATAVRRAADSTELPAVRRPLLDLADDLLGEAPPLRLRGIPADRILAGFVSRRLAGATLGARTA